MSIRKPLKRIQDLKGDERKVILCLVRMFTNDMPEMKQKLGIECTEEALISLINMGLVKIMQDTDENNETIYYLKTYDVIVDNYI